MYTIYKSDKLMDLKKKLKNAKIASTHVLQAMYRTYVKDVLANT